MTIPFTDEQRRLKNIFDPYFVYDLKLGPKLVDDAPKEAVEAYKKCLQIEKEQEEREIALMDIKITKYKT